MKMNTWVKLAVMTGAGGVLAVGCGTQTSSPPPATSAPATSSVSTAPPTVAKLTTSKTAQLLMAASAAKSTTNEASFTVTAYTASGQPAAGEPVSFYIGPMVPLSGVPPHAWYQTGTADAAKYVASYSPTTNSQGQATITLYGQPTGTMEMIGVDVGNLKTFSTTADKALGSMDAWWTAPSAAAGTSIGDYLVASPFAQTVSPGKSVQLTVTAMGPHGPLSGAKVSFSSKGMGSMAATVTSTSSQGITSYMVMTGSTMTPVRVVATVGSSGIRVAGGLNALFVATGTSAMPSSSASMSSASGMTSSAMPSSSPMASMSTMTSSSGM